MEDPKPRGHIGSQIQMLDKEVIALSMTRDAFQYQRMLYNLTNLLEQRKLAIMSKQATNNEAWIQDYNNYIEKVNEDIMKLLGI